MTSHRAHPVRMWGALLALVIALLLSGVGVANAASTAPGIDLGDGSGPTTTVTAAGGGLIELIPPASSQLPDEPTTAAVSSSEIEVQGVSSSTGPTSAAGVDAPISLMWIVIGALVLLGGAALILTRWRRVAQH